VGDAQAAVRARLQGQRGGGASSGAPAAEGADVRALLEKNKTGIMAALPKHVSVDRMLRVTLTAVRTNPELAKCDGTSLIAAVMQAAQLGLEPGILGHAYLVPFWNYKEKRRDVQLIVGYQGMIDLARRSGKVSSISAHAVRERDEFDFAYGLNETLTHKPAAGERGDITHAYAVVRFVDGGYAMVVLSRHEIEAFRMRGASGKKTQSGEPVRTPWDTDYEAMCVKTAIRRLFTYMPKSVEMQNAMAADGAVKHEISADMSSILPDPETIDAEAYDPVATGVDLSASAEVAAPGPNLLDDSPAPEAPAAQATLQTPSADTVGVSKAEGAPF